MSSKTAWFETWFDSEYYHLLYRHRDDEEAKRFLDNLVDYLDIDRGSSILDLACGKGRHSVYLESLGYKVTGADLSTNSIEYARQFENENLHFLVHDMREPIGDNDFDVILNLFTSFGYFDDELDNLRVLRSIGQALKPGGTTLIDFMNVRKVIDNLVRNESKVIDGVCFDIHRYFTDSHIFKEISIRDKDKDVEFQFTERVQIITREAMLDLVTSAGFESVELKGNYDLEPFDERKTDRLIVIAKKPK